MAILASGNTIATGNQASAAVQNAQVNNATFDTGATDEVTTTQSGGAIIVKDGGVTPAKLSTGAPSWASAGDLTLNGSSADDLSIVMSVSDAAMFIHGGGSTSNGAGIELYGSSHATRPDEIIIDADVHIFRAQDGATEIARINATGTKVFLVGRTTPASFGSTTDEGITMQTDRVEISRSGDVPFFLQRTSSDGTIQSFFRQTTQVGTISVTASATAYNTSSDYRLKENIVPLLNATERLIQLKPTRFSFKSDDASTVVDGFLAHEVQEVVPEAVTGEKNGEEMQQMDAAKLVPLLTAALQDALVRIDRLENASK